jgi:transposase
MKNAQQRHDISDEVWDKIKDILPGRKGTWGGNAVDNRSFINGVFWILRTGAPWRDLPECYGKWNTIFRRFCRWRDNGVWGKLLESFIEEPDLEWLMIDASHIKVHHQAVGARGGNQAMGLTKGGSTLKFTLPWLKTVCRSELLLRKAPEMIAHKLSS